MQPRLCSITAPASDYQRRRRDGTQLDRFAALETAFGGSHLILKSGFIPEHHEGGFQQDQYVIPDRPVLDIEAIKPCSATDIFVPQDWPAGAFNLGKTSDSRTCDPAQLIAGQGLFKIMVMRHGVWPGSDQRHLALQYIKQLRQLVEACSAQERANRSEARVSADGLSYICTVFRHMHGPKLIDFECFSAPSDPRLLKDYTAGAADFDGKCHAYQNRQQGDQEERHTDDVKDSLGRTAHRRRDGLWDFKILILCARLANH